MTTEPTATEPENTQPQTDSVEQAEDAASLVNVRDVMPTLLHILPLSNRPFFPGQAIPLVIDGDAWTETLQAVADTAHKMVGLVLAEKADLALVTPEDFARMGTVCRVHRVVQVEDKLQVLVEGLQRFSISDWVSKQRPLLVRPHYHPETRYDTVPELKSYVLAVINTIKELLPLNPLYGEELKLFLERFGPEEPSHLADFAASLTTSSKQELQEVLEEVHILKRLEKVLILLNKELRMAKAQVEIRRQVEEKIQNQQREFFLREQLKTIQKELGLEKDDRTAELEKYKARLKKLSVPEAVQATIAEEMDKFAVLETGSPEYSVTRNYLDWLTLMPWGVYSNDKLDIKKARRVLDRDHEGLEDVKDRIIEFLAVGRMKGNVGGTILLLVGPPGVGKTSIGRSIAAALGRSFFRFSVGGIRDEAEIKGHRRTYIGAMPGKFIQAMKEVKTANPLIMLDEIDKVGASYHGDPASALLEVLDPEQNVDFLDHYLDVRFDLSKVLFICTANQLDTIPSPLLDRMEMIQLAGYLTGEKLRIAKKHLFKRQLDKTGLTPAQLHITDATFCHIIESYAREAGVRTLEKRIGAIARKATIKLLQGEAAPIRVTPKNLEHFLGKPVFENEPPLSGVGVVTGLAWTPLGGATLSVEAARIHSHARGFKLTGQLGEVMKESAEIAYSYVTSQAERLGIDAKFFEQGFIHLHVPAGATPKDGPSAGVTMASALVSLGRGQELPRRLAMTGELTLTGEILPVGGIREKIIAARRVDVLELILPQANRRDFADLPEYVREGLQVHFVRRYPELFALLWGTV